MLKKLHASLVLLLFGAIGFGQLKSGPMLGAIELRTAYIWCELNAASQIKLEYWKLGDRRKVFHLIPSNFDRFNFKIREFFLTELEPGTSYQYQIVVDGKLRPNHAAGTFTTQKLWKWREDAPDFSFLAGSCAYFNDSIFDRPGRAYGGDSNIFLSMAKENAAMMLWLGDNWYYREVDFDSEWGLWYRASKDRSFPTLQPFLKAMSHYAIWDDHDYGPNNEGVAYIFKNEAKQIFTNYWSNPAKTQLQKGVYTKMSYSDVDFFMMDGRSFRSSDDMNDSLKANPNPNKVMWGLEQMNWLKNQLLNSRATFKLIANGSPILNQYNKYDCMVHYINEFQELIDFIIEEKISGVLFFTGDRHHSEITSRKLSDSYTTYDITSSSLTSGIYKLNDYEKSNPDLLVDLLIDQNNYTKVSVHGKPKERKLKVEFMDIKGMKLKEWEVHENQLKFLKY
ncbi:MAG: alkaline phosphatase family protein [Saprospiraceae bacterium]|nr:alkaline phosphatase family protein [Saprospiraceae bacterium]